MPWIAAPTATASSGFTSSINGSFERSATMSRTIGIRDMIDDHVVPIFAAEPMITVCRDHLDALAFDPHDRDVERAAAEVEHKNRLVFLELVEAVRNGCRCWFIDDLKNVKSGQLARGYRRGPFRVVEVGRDRDHSVGYRFLEIFFRVGFQLSQNQRG